MNYLDVMKSESTHGGEVIVYFGDVDDDEKYYAHSIFEKGEETDKSGSFTMWGWINHLRSKRWWSSSTERDFIDEVGKYL